MPLKLAHSEAARRETVLSSEDMLFLDELRRHALACRAKPRADLFEACALLKVTRAASLETHALTLMRCLHEALGQPARLHAPGTADLTFDERWLLELGRASVRDDPASLAFLLGRRVHREKQRLVRFLMAHIADCFFRRAVG